MERFYAVSMQVSKNGKQYLDNLVGMKMAISKSEALKTSMKYSMFNN